MFEAANLLVPLAAADQPAIDDSMLAKAKVVAAVELCNVLRSDFAVTLRHLIESGAAPAARRNLVRCFGSLTEGLADAMRSIAVVACEFHGKNYNRFLNAKSVERNIATQNRIESAYRVVHEALPKSPLARVPDQRWDDLHRCLELRNRVTHPRSAAELEITGEELELLTRTAGEFTHDFSVFVQCHAQKQQKLGWEAGGQRVRDIPKVGRNEKCP